MYKTELVQANHHFNEGEHKEAAELYTTICLHCPLHEVPKKTLVSASRTLGFQLSNGIGIEKNPRRAVQMYRIAVALDDPASTCNLASMWFDGVPSINKATKEPSTVVLRQDPIRGANLLGRLLSRVSYVPAIVELGRCYFTGEGVAFDPARATELWTRAEKLAISLKYLMVQKLVVLSIPHPQGPSRNPFSYTIQKDDNFSTGEIEKITCTVISFRKSNSRLINFLIYCS